MFLEKLDIFVIIYLDNILIYTKNFNKIYVNIVYWVIDQLKTYSLFIKFKKCCFYKDKMRFHNYIIFIYGIKMKNQKTEIIKM